MRPLYLFAAAFTAVIGLFACPPAYSGSLTHEQARSFISLLCKPNSDLSEYIDSIELANSRRLGIDYEGVDNKYLIGRELSPDLIAAVRGDSGKYELSVSDLGDGYDKLLLKLPGSDKTTEFLFKESKLVLPSAYYTRGWHRYDSPHFEFIVSDTTRINKFSIDRLEQFVTSFMNLLNFSGDLRERLASAKIEYVLCKDPEEVGLVVGHEGRGMYELATDRVVTCFPAHFHELVHLLVNYRLQHLPLFVHPLLQEGIAVALGGRGGLAPQVIAELGDFLVESGVGDVNEMASYQAFAATHPSISYPVSGLFVKYLLEELGSEQFLRLYSRYAGSEGEVDAMTIPIVEIAPEEQWREYCAGIGSEHLINPVTDDGGYAEIYHDSSLVVGEDDSSFLIEVADTAFLGRDKALAYFRGDKVKDFFAPGSYRGEEYAIAANGQEVQIYNLYTDNLIANLVCGFRTGVDSIPQQGGFYRFAVRKSVLPDLPKILNPH